MKKRIEQQLNALQTELGNSLPEITISKELNDIDEQVETEDETEYDKIKITGDNGQIKPDILSEFGIQQRAGKRIKQKGGEEIESNIENIKNS